MSAPLCPTAIVGLMTLTLGRVGDAFEIFHTVQRGATGHKDYGKGVARCPDGSIAVVGGTKWALPGETPSSSADSDDMFIVKYSAAYEVLWTVQRGTSGTDMAMSVACNPTVTLTFKFMSIMIMIRTPTHGPWQHPCLSFAALSSPTSPFSTHVLWYFVGAPVPPPMHLLMSSCWSPLPQDGSYTVVGRTNQGMLGQPHIGGQDIFVMKLSAAGEILWTKQHGTTGHDIIASGCVVVDPTNGASILTFSGNYNIVVMRISATGEVVWTLQYGSSSTDYPAGIARHPDGTFAVVGSTSAALPGANAWGPLGGDDMFISKISSAGEVIRTVQYGGTRRPTYPNNPSSDYCTGVAFSTADDAFVAVGKTDGAFPGQVCIARTRPRLARNNHRATACLLAHRNCAVLCAVWPLCAEPHHQLSCLLMPFNRPTPAKATLSNTDILGKHMMWSLSSLARLSMWAGQGSLAAKRTSPAEGPRARQVSRATHTAPVLSRATPTMARCWARPMWVMAKTRSSSSSTRPQGG